MFKMSEYSFIAAFIALGLATLLYAWYFVGLRRARMLLALETGAPGAGVTTEATSLPAGWYGTLLAANAVAFLTLSLIFRTIATGHGPFANMYEFSVAFTWGIMIVYLYVERRFQARALGAFVTPIAMAMMWYASTVPSNIEPLVPALQNNLLLTVHVAVAIVAYGAFSVAFGGAILYLLQRDDAVDWLPSSAVLDELSYRSVIIGFPMMALVIILGAVWADVAWGTYWSWDPKETASLVTWLVYGGYLHARSVRGWRGIRSALLLLLGFGLTLLTYFGNLFFGGLHSYSGLV
jgi:cytochrome c-type biogenesis protein CcsB